MVLLVQVDPDHNQVVALEDNREDLLAEHLVKASQEDNREALLAAK